MMLTQVWMMWVLVLCITGCILYYPLSNHPLSNHPLVARKSER